MKKTALGVGGESATNTEPETFADGQALRDVLLVAFTAGNIVFLGFGIAEIEGPDVVPVIFAISTFAVGSYLGLRIATQHSRKSGPWPPAMTVLLVLTATAEGAFLVGWV